MTLPVEEPAGGSDDAANEETAAYQVAMITDYGDITDQSFTRPPMRPARSFAPRTAWSSTITSPPVTPPPSAWPWWTPPVADGYNVVVMPGYAFAETIKETAELYPDVTFIALGRVRWRSEPR